VPTHCRREEDTLVRDETKLRRHPFPAARCGASPILRYIYICLYSMYDAYPATSRTVHLEIREAIQYSTTSYIQCTTIITEEPILLSAASWGLHRTSARSNHQPQPRRHGPACPRATSVLGSWARARRETNWQAPFLWEERTTDQTSERTSKQRETMMLDDDLITTTTTGSFFSFFSPFVSPFFFPPSLPAGLVEEPRETFGLQTGTAPLSRRSWSGALSFLAVSCFTT
jgi:hypothetical protein